MTLRRNSSLFVEGLSGRGSTFIGNEKESCERLLSGTRQHFRRKRLFFFYSFFFSPLLDSSVVEEDDAIIRRLINIHLVFVGGETIFPALCS
ncbi:hypothetical protein CEXT_621871 [Caerostris extrusa]|uniref:Uncharacterized protein n=1 Tax=Caerostris extrusa TaxID=172846 RepID=A0AAV4N8M6_CAEEX|nr:hypothetical protein CEXT_621871 [Caerostris extrusa]